MIIAVATIAFVSNVSAFVPMSSGKRRGVKGSSLQMTILTYNGKKKDFKAGSPLSSAAAALGVKPKYSCKKSVKFLRELDPIKCVFLSMDHWFSLSALYRILGETADRAPYLSAASALRRV